MSFFVCPKCGSSNISGGGNTDGNWSWNCKSCGTNGRGSDPKSPKPVWKEEYKKKAERSKLKK